MFEKGDIMETIRNVDVNRLHDFKNHPFKVEMNTELCELMRSIEKEGLYHYEHDYLIKHFATDFKKKYGVDCYAALHHNKRKTNFHIHLIFAERTKLEKPVVKVASRNMFYDERGKHVRTKKEILDASGDIRNGCKIIRKGEVYEKKEFSIKVDRFKKDSFLDEAKVFFTNEINQLVLHEEDKLKVFDKNSPYLATKKIGKIIQWKNK